MCRWWNDGSIMAHAGFPQGLGTTAREVTAQLQADASSHRLLLLEQGCPVGEAVWRTAGEPGTAEIGIKLCVPSARGRGLGTQYLHRLLRYLFGPGGFRLVTLTTAAENRRARHVYEKLGFVQTAAFSFQTKQMPQACEALEYRLKNEYNVDIRMQNLPYSFIRWIENEDCDPKALNLTSDTRRVEDFKGRKLLLFTNAWSITWAEEHNKELRLSEVGR